MFLESFDNGGDITMITIFAFIAAVLIFAWGWHRLYKHNMRKGARKGVAHTFGVLIGIFPALFFFYACFATFPPPDMEPPSTGSLVGLWVIFAIAAAMLLYLTTRPIPQDDNKTSLPTVNKTKQ